MSSLPPLERALTVPEFISFFSTIGKCLVCVLYNKKVWQVEIVTKYQNKIFARTYRFDKFIHIYSKSKDLVDLVVRKICQTFE